MLCACQLPRTQTLNRNYIVSTYFLLKKTVLLISLMQKLVNEKLSIKSGTRSSWYYRKPPITSLTNQLIPSVRPGRARNLSTSGSMRPYLWSGKKGRRTAWSQVSCEQAHLCKFGENYLAAEPCREEKWVEWRVRRPRGGGRGYFLTRPSQEANGDVLLDGVAFSRLEWL